MNKILNQNWSAFSTEQCDALFAAFWVHDEIFLDSTLPEVVHLDYTIEQLTQCYQLSLQVWGIGWTRNELFNIIKNIDLHRALNEAEQLQFKYIRGRFKHLRFAFKAFDEKHRYPDLFQWLTGEMGQLQDALKNSQPKALRRPLITIKILLSRFCFNLILRSLARFKICTVDSFRKYVREEIDFIRQHLAKNKVTNHDFHEMRKVISRLVALYDNLRILFPSEYHQGIARYLSTLNGLMGGLHDQMIIEKFNSTEDYFSNPLEIPSEIAVRLALLVQKFESLK